MEGRTTGGKDFFCEKKWRGKDFFLQKKWRGKDFFFTKKMTGRRLFFTKKMTGQDLFFSNLRWGASTFLKGQYDGARIFLWAMKGHEGSKKNFSTKKGQIQYLQGRIKNIYFPDFPAKFPDIIGSLTFFWAPQTTERAAKLTTQKKQALMAAKIVFSQCRTV